MPFKAPRPLQAVTRVTALSCRTGLKNNFDVLGVRKQSKLLVLASEANPYFRVLDGFVACGKRLADELELIILKYPSLQYISIIAHAAGGLFARYALGTLYRPEDGTIAGLKPQHYICMATPFWGYGDEGTNQIPIIDWLGRYPIFGGYIFKYLTSHSNLLACKVFRQLGEDFFYNDVDDDDENSEAIYVRLGQNSEEGHFFDALKAFSSRTCVANASGDSLVNWASGSLRRASELPRLGDVRNAIGIVRRDPIETGFWRPVNVSGGTKPTSDSTKELYKGLNGKIMSSLRKLPWCRLDCSFEGACFPFFSHSLMQVRFQSLHWEGEVFAPQLVHHFEHLEAKLKEPNVAPQA